MPTEEDHEDYADGKRSARAVLQKTPFSEEKLSSVRAAIVALKERLELPPPSPYLSGMLVSYQEYSDRFATETAPTETQAFRVDK